MDFRTEEDFLGRIDVPAEAYYGIHTVRARENFPVSGFSVPHELVLSLATVKQACAIANMGAGLLPHNIGKAIVTAASEVADNELADQFITDAFQGGAGTSLNMNMNEVLANRAVELMGGVKGDYKLVSPLDHVNLSQSTNDVYPTALKVAAIRLVLELAEEMARLQGSLQKKEAEFAHVLKLGRTEMQDAVPITLGQEFSAYSEAIARDRWRLYKVEERLRQVNLGGTAVGTGLNADRKYIYAAVEELQNLTGLGISRAENSIDPTQNADVFVEVSGLVRTAAVNLAKIASDLRLMSAGPRGGIGEIMLPPVQAGSSIMPGKINPVITEMVSQVAFQVMALDQAVAMAAAGGNFELNAFLPLIAYNLLNSLKMLRQATFLFRTRCIDGIEANEARCRKWLEESLCLATVLAPYIGHEEAGSLARQAAAEGKTIAQLAVESGAFTPEEIGTILSTPELTRPGVAGAKKIKKKCKDRKNSNGESLKDNTLNETPRGSRLHIALFGRRNAGKSSLVNALTNQELAIVSPVAGTTTDPVYKSMEILPIGPVVLIDTAGLDDTGDLGSLRVKKTRAVLAKTDLLLLVIDPDLAMGVHEEELIADAKKHNVPVVAALNKTDLRSQDEAKRKLEQLGVPAVEVSALTCDGIDVLKSAIVKVAPKDRASATILGDLISPGDMVVLVVPIDLAAPKGRLILPQVQTIRDILDNDAMAMVVKERELKAALSSLKEKPRLVVTDSQAFLKVAADTPKDVALTSFSILFARHKGNLEALVRGVKTVELLEPGDRVLIAEACTHHRVEDDIGSVKIPRWLRQQVGGDLGFTWASGLELPADLQDYKLVIHCGACMINRKEMLHRVAASQEAGVPIVNYGVLIAFMMGILPRALAPFPEARTLLDEKDE